MNFGAEQWESVTVSLGPLSSPACVPKVRKLHVDTTHPAMSLSEGLTPFKVEHVNFQVALVVKNPPARADVRDLGSIPGSERSHGRGNDNPLQYSLLENPMERGAWWGTVQSQKESDTIEATEHTCALGLICLCFTWNNLFLSNHAQSLFVFKAKMSLLYRWIFLFLRHSVSFLSWKVSAENICW